MPLERDEQIQILEALGWDLRESGSQLLCSCPFCGKDKLYVDPKRTTWDCKVCGESGNALSAIGKMHEAVYSPALTPALRGKLATARGIPESAFEACPNLGWDAAQGRYTWLARKPGGASVTLRTWVPHRPGGRKNAVHNLKATSLVPIGCEELEDKDRKSWEVWICEGEWDYHAALFLREVEGLEVIPLALPGAGSFKKEWAQWFAGRDVVGLHDCDEAGRGGSVRMQAVLRGVARSLRFLHWPRKDRAETGGLDDGYDLHDLVRDNLEEPGRAVKYVRDRLRPDPTGEVQQAAAVVGGAGDRRRAEQENLEPCGVDELHAVFDRWLHLTNHDLLDVTMAALWTLHLPGNPLWMFIVAPPSGSKSETIMPASAWWRCHALSNMTSKALISGFQGPGGADPSLLAALNGQRAAIAIKDLTPLLQGRPEERDEVFGILRDAYDGAVSKVFGNGLRRDYKELHFTVLAGVTPAVDTMGHAAFGERFLKFRADRDMDRADDMDRALRAIKNCGSETSMRDELREACVRSLQRDFDPEALPSPSRTFAELVARLALLVAALRAVAPVERGTDKQTMAPVVEAPPRLATQLVKFAQGLAMHLEATTLDDPRVTRLVRRVALHTVDTIPAQVAQVLEALQNPAGVEAKDVNALLPRLSRETVFDVLRRMQRTGSVLCRKDTTATRWVLTDRFSSLLRETAFFRDLPEEDVHYRSDLPQPGVPVRKPVLVVKRRKAS